MIATVRALEVAAERSPELRVKPLAIFAAGRERFEALIPGFSNSIQAKIAVFAELPLEENGWDRAQASVRHIRNVPEGMIWLAERN